MPPRTRLKDIAESLNVSIATVSRALNNKFDINAETRNAILKKAEELNYRPNALAVSLRKNENFTIGVILPSVDHYFFSTVLKGIMNKAHQANYLVIIGESNHNPEREKELINQCATHCVTGLIISLASTDINHENLKFIKSNRIPYVLVDRPSKNEDDTFVKYDDEGGARLATEHLIAQGYKKIAMLKGKDSCSISESRFNGYTKALLKRGMAVDHDLIRSSSAAQGPEDGYFLSKELLLSKKKPDAIFCVNDDIAAGVYQASQELNLNIPDDLAVVGYSNSIISKHLSPTLTTVVQPGADMGEQAFDFLQQILIGNSSKLSRTFDARLLVRESSCKVI